MFFKFITTQDLEYDLERKLRSRMLREPLGFPAGAELFPFEDEAIHLVAIENDTVIGCVMFKPEGKTGRMLQMAVDTSWQSKGVGRNLVEKMEDHLKELGFTEIYTHSRMLVVPFYKKMGFSPEGEPFMEIGIKHQKMVKKIIKP